MTSGTPPPPALSDEQRKGVLKKQIDETDYRAFASAFSELLFVILPFVVIAIAFTHRGDLRTLAFIPEWSIVSAVIVGQSIVKLASLGIGRASAKRENLVLLISALLVCLLVPILIILAIALTSPTVSLLLAITQILLFLLSLFILGMALFFEHRLRIKEKQSSGV